MTGVIRHIVLFTLNPAVTDQDPRVRQAVIAEHELTAVAPSWRFGANPTGRRDAADFAATGDFVDAVELAAFLRHPAHQAAAHAWNDIAACHVADVELDAGSA